jgi:hypothetical protein
MKSQNLLFDEAFEFVKKARPVINPNANFRRQLRLYQHILKDILNLEKISALWRLHSMALLKKRATYFRGKEIFLNFLLIVFRIRTNYVYKSRVCTATDQRKSRL